jgi:protein TonB
MGVRAVLHRESTRRHRILARDQRTRPPEDPLGDLPKVVEKMTATETDAVLRLVAQQARLVTAATGAAIALGAREEFFCRATAGDKAPPVGARIRSDSGLTGECLRRRVTLRCDDAERDERVDAEACRELQVRSIAVVPIRMGTEVAGVVEVFSHHVSAFSNAHVATLERVADLVGAVCHRAASLIVEAASAPADEPKVQAPAVAVQVVSPATAPDVRVKLKDMAAEAVAYGRDAAAAVRPHLVVLRRTTNSWMLAALASLFVLLAVLGYFVGRARRHAPAVESILPVAESAAPVTRAATSPSEPGESLTKGAASVTQQQVTAEKKPSAKVTPAPRPAAQEPEAKEPEVLTVSPGTRVKQARRAELDVAAPPDVDKIAGTTSSGVETAILSTAVVAPKLLPQPKPLVVSQGVVPGRLIHKINPSYPVQAREARVHGAVVLNVSIEKTGKVGKVRVISGHPLLSQAAVQAVKSWVYEPFRLNGQPVDAETQVTVNFSD